MTRNIIIDGVRYADVPGLYELIFKRIPDDLLYERRYEQIQKHSDGDEFAQVLIAGSIILSNREYKHKYVIASLILITPKKQKKKSGKGLPHAMILNDNAIDYVERTSGSFMIAQRFAPNG